MESLINLADRIERLLQRVASWGSWAFIVIDAAALARMKRGAILVNVARGGVVVEADLVRALRDGAIHAAAADVYATEPLPPDSPLLGVPNLTTTPHLAAIAADNFEPTVRRMFANVLRVSRGEPIPADDLVVG